MRRPRNAAPKVWHNPDVDISARRGASSTTSTSTRSTSGRSGTNGRTRRANSGRPNGGQARNARPHGHPAQGHRAALDALFAPKDEAATSAPEPQRVVRAGRIVHAPLRNADPETLERERLLGALLEAESRPVITRATNAFVAAGHELPSDQAVQLQLLEHQDESRVLEAIVTLSKLLLEEPLRRRAVLVSRLRRIEEYADDDATRTAASSLLRQTSGRAPQAAAPAP